MISMKNYLITFRSVTYAQRGERVLKKAGINCWMRRTPRILSNWECGYCLQLRSGDLSRAISLLQEGQVQFGKAYGQYSSGEFEEIEL